MTESVIGRSLPRPNARRAASGRGRHVADLGFKRLVDVAFVRSPYAHARIGTIETAEAEARPGVVAVLTGAGLAERTQPWAGDDEERAVVGLRGRNTAWRSIARAGRASPWPPSSPKAGRGPRTPRSMCASSGKNSPPLPTSRRRSMTERPILHLVARDQPAL